MLFEKAEVFKTVNGVIFIYSGLPREKASPDRLKAQLEISPASLPTSFAWRHGVQFRRQVGIVSIQSENRQM
jgi:hypothetical protein